MRPEIPRPPLGSREEYYTGQPLSNELQTDFDIFDRHRGDSRLSPDSAATPHSSMGIWVVSSEPDGTPPSSGRNPTQLRTSSGKNPTQLRHHQGRIQCDSAIVRKEPDATPPSSRKNPTRLRRIHHFYQDSASSREKSAIARKTHATLAEHVEAPWGHRSGNSADCSIGRGAVATRYSIEGSRRRVKTQHRGRPRRMLDPLPPIAAFADQHPCWSVYAGGM